MLRRFYMDVCNLTKRMVIAQEHIKKKLTYRLTINVGFDMYLSPTLIAAVTPVRICFAQKNILDLWYCDKKTPII